MRRKQNLASALGIILQILLINYLRKIRGYPQFSFWISITLVKICFSRIFSKPRKKSFVLVGTFLKNPNVSPIGVSTRDPPLERGPTLNELSLVARNVITMYYILLYRVSKQKNKQRRNQNDKYELKRTRKHPNNRQGHKWSLV